MESDVLLRRSSSFCLVTRSSKNANGQASKEAHLCTIKGLQIAPQASHFDLKEDTYYDCTDGLENCIAQGGSCYLVLYVQVKSFLAALTQSLSLNE